MKIALSGTEGTGKSTLATKIGQQHRIPVIPEFAREVSAGMDLGKPRDMTPQEALMFQNKILEKKLFEESKHESFIADRSTADNLAYYLRWCARGIDDKISKIYTDMCVKNLVKYDRVFVLPCDGIPHENDGFRSTNLFYKYEIHCLILGILEDQNISYEVLDEPDFDKRVKIVGGSFV